jgi:hypothetical protein
MRMNTGYTIKKHELRTMMSWPISKYCGSIHGYSQPRLQSAATRVRVKSVKEGEKRKKETERKNKARREGRKTEGWRKGRHTKDGKETNKEGEDGKQEEKKE